MKLTYQRALWAAYTVLDRLFNDNDPYKLGQILSEMNPFLFTSWVCADPYLWEVWTDRCKAINDSGYLTFEQVMPALVDFLKFNEEEYTCFEEYGVKYSADEVISGISEYEKNGRWQEILDKVYNFDERDWD